MIDARAAQLPEDFIEEGDACNYDLQMLAKTTTKGADTHFTFP